MHELTFTNLIIAFTCFISIWAFQNTEVRIKCKHWPFVEIRDGEYYRWLTNGLIHADYMHLAFNMITLYYFGNFVERMFAVLFPAGKLIYLLFYFAAIICSGLPTFFKHKNNPSFASLGASGAVSAVLFAAILFNPTMEIGMMFIPMGIPGWIFGVLYLIFSHWASRNSMDNIDHEAHFFGAVFGFLLPLVWKPDLISTFLEQLNL